ncbi:uncharacterized protein LOC111396259 [Olea europaea subsp. europaea]|uniref:Uncharacterized protein LOC111396259 n=1 Tax=Olea europaea subsp. europaea TaxID=158383 RepID=A0A8S0TJT9_OLEEU|nr:uncharacterized protein LOC111396259 [Olea europaea subsp. europaea]
MSVVRWNQNELGSTGEKELKGGPLPPTTLAAIESLAIPLVQEVVFLADFRCSGCQQRVAEIMSKMNGETQSVMVSILEKKPVYKLRVNTDAVLRVAIRDHLSMVVAAYDGRMQRF